jgi:hypothetical protein
MASHEVSLNLSRPVPINRSKTAYHLDWPEFAKVMAEAGHPA